MEEKMLDLKFVRENPDIVKQNIKNKFQDRKLPLVDEVIELDAQARATKTEADEIRANRNKHSKQNGALMAQGKTEEAETVKAQVNTDADRLKELEAKVEEIPTLIAAATEEGIKKGKADADKSNAFEVRALKKDAEYQKQLLEDKNERLAEDLANARAEKVELQQKLDDAYAQMRELAAKTVESTGGVKILNGQTQQNNK